MCECVCVQRKAANIRKQAINHSFGLAHNDLCTQSEGGNELMSSHQGKVEEAERLEKYRRDTAVSQGK